jgi:SLT domain-containing protein
LLQKGTNVTKLKKRKNAFVDVGSSYPSDFVLPKECKMNTKTLVTILTMGLILWSLVSLAGCSIPVALAMPVNVDVEDEYARSWEIDAEDISAAREAARVLAENYNADSEYLEEGFLARSWEISAGDLEAAREAAEALSQSVVTYSGDPYEYDSARIWEIDAEDFAAAREAAHTLSQLFTAGEVGDMTSWEITIEDIQAARQAAETLSKLYTADDLRGWGMSAGDIAAAHEVIRIISQDYQAEGE